MCVWAAVRLSRLLPLTSLICTILAAFPGGVSMASGSELSTKSSLQSFDLADRVFGLMSFYRIIGEMGVIVEGEN